LIDQVNDQLEDVTDQASVTLLQKRNKLGVSTPDLGPQAYGDGRLSAIAERESIVPHEMTHVIQQGAPSDVVQTGAQVVDNAIGDVKPTVKRAAQDPAGALTMLGQGIQNMQEGGGPEIIDVADPIQPLRRIMKRGRDAHITLCAAFDGHGRDIIVAHVFTGPAQAGGNDAGKVARLEAARCEALGERDEVHLDHPVFRLRARLAKFTVDDHPRVVDEDVGR
jgi:hypothetical protein